MPEESIQVFPRSAPVILGFPEQPHETSRCRDCIACSSMATRYFDTEIIRYIIERSLPEIRAPDAR
jgi:hypothetical protein